MNKCQFCNREIKEGEKTKRLRSLFDRRYKELSHYDCWLDYGVRQIGGLANQISKEEHNLQPVNTPQE